MSAQSSSATEAPRMSVLQRIYGVFVSPKATFADIARQPDWMVPFMLGLIGAALSGFYMQDLIWEMTREQMQNNPNIAPDQLETTLQAAEGWIRISSWLMPPLTTALMYAVIAGILLFTGNVLLGGEARFKPVFSAVCWSGLVNILNSVVNIPIMRSRGELVSATNLTFLAPGAEMQSPTYFLLSQLDLFYIWWVALIGMGFAAVYQYPPRKGMTVAALWWGVFIVIAMGFKLVF